MDGSNFFAINLKESTEISCQIGSTTFEKNRISTEISWVPHRFTADHSWRLCAAQDHYGSCWSSLPTMTGPTCIALQFSRTGATRWRFLGPMDSAIHHDSPIFAGDFCHWLARFLYGYPFESQPYHCQTGDKKRLGSRFFRRKLSTAWSARRERLFVRAKKGWVFWRKKLLNDT